MITDTHAHICDPVFDADRQEVLARAESAGIGAVIAVGENLADAARNLELAAAHPMLRPAAGLYPAHLDLEQAREMLAFIRRERQRLTAIGEVGLDFWLVKEEEGRERQRQIFKSFIELSLELDLPLNIHSRSAGRHVVSMLLDLNARKVQLHAFDGKASSALPAVEAGYFFSVPPSIIRSPQKQKLFKQLPLSCLLIETDSPVLGPVPDLRNEPVNAMLAVQAVAELKGTSAAEIIAAAEDNARKLYGI